MGNIEKYGVVALLFVIVMVLAVSIWGPRTSETARLDAKPEAEGSTAGLPESDGLRGQEEPVAKPLVLPVEESAPAGGERPPVTGAPSAAEPAPSGAAVPAVLGSEEYARYKIQQGDTLEDVARKKLGSRSRWPEILKLNEGLNPSRLRIGQEILLPKSEESASVKEAASAPGGPQSYKIVRGDTFYDIAKKLYGNGAKWRRIYEANKDKVRDPEVLPEGVILTIP